MKRIPDTITTWRASAFSVGNGFGITDSVAKASYHFVFIISITYYLFCKLSLSPSSCRFS